MRDSVARLKATLGQLLAGAHEQLTAFDQASTSDPAHLRALGANLWKAIERLDRMAILVIVNTRASGWDVTWQRWLVNQLATLHDRARRLLALVSPADELQSRRLATRVSALDPLALYRNGLGIADVEGKLIAGPGFCGTHHYPNRDVIAGVSLRDVDLSLANLATSGLSYVDARGANLEDVIATSARLWRVCLAGASMRAAELEHAVASGCDFRNADLVNARWNNGAVTNCSFAGADLMDMNADRMMFMFCDFQGADLTASLDANVTMMDTRFVKCDLRWSRWHNRKLETVHFIECKLHGVQGANLDGAFVERPDLSPAGDGSRVGSLADLLVSNALRKEVS